MNRIDALEQALSALLAVVHEMAPPALQETVNEIMNEWAGEE